MRLEGISILIGLCIGCCRTQQNGNWRLRLSAKFLDGYFTATNGTLFKEYFGQTRIEAKLVGITYQLIPDTHKVKLECQLNSVIVYDTGLHRIDDALVEIDFQIQKQDEGEVNLSLSMCSFTATSNTNLLETSYLTAAIQGHVCGKLQSQLVLYQNSQKIPTPTGSIRIKCQPVEPSGVFRDHVELTFNCNAAVMNSATVTNTLIEPVSPLPPLPMFDADKATLEMQSSDRLQEITLLALHSFRFPGPTRRIRPTSTDPLFTQIVPILSQIESATGLAPMLQLTGGFSNLTVNNTHISVVVTVDERIDTYFDGVILNCKIDWQLTIQMGDGQQRWLNVTDLLNGNVTFDNINVTVIQSKLANNSAIVDKMCNQLHTAFSRNQIVDEISNDQFIPYMSVLLQDSVLVTKTDYGKFLRHLAMRYRPSNL